MVVLLKDSLGLCPDLGLAVRMPAMQKHSVINPPVTSHESTVTTISDSL